MLVEIFEKSSTKKLQDAINKFLTGLSDVVKVIDIKYTNPITTEYWAEGDPTMTDVYDEYMKKRP